MLPLFSVFVSVFSCLDYWIGVLGSTVRFQAACQFSRVLLRLGFIPRCGFERYLGSHLLGLGLGYSFCNTVLSGIWILMFSTFSVRMGLFVPRYGFESYPGSRFLSRNWDFSSAVRFQAVILVLVFAACDVGVGSTLRVLTFSAWIEILGSAVQFRV